MRIIGGTHKRRTIKEVPHTSTRSTRDRVKENLFNMLPNLGGMSILDAFAGSGALGFEALSRGARNATFIETDRMAFKVLSENVTRLEFDEVSTLFRGDAHRILKRLEGAFDTILFDPPYKKGLIDQALPIIKDRKLLENGGMIVLLHASDEAPLIPDAFKQFKTRTYGITSLTFLKWSD